ncbi:MAG: hypothetical protein J5483_02855 [Lachnospiraceae bacterium]|nr:hypothetical protein [Lachnospiraceae bacterium]
MKHWGKKLLGFLLCVALMVSILPATIPVSGAEAEEGIISLGIAKGNMINFGKNLWRVLQSGDGKALLISDTILEGIIFSGNGNAWSGSNAQAWCTGYYANWSDEIEKRAILATTVTEPEDYSYVPEDPDPLLGEDLRFGGASLQNEHFFFLSAEEADTLFADNNDRKLSSSWLLRSPEYDRSNTNKVGIINRDGRISSRYFGAEDGVRPAFNLDLNAVVFTSLVPSTENNLYNLTLLDKDITLTCEEATRDGSRITVPCKVSGDNRANVDRLLLVITDGTWGDGGWSEGASIKDRDWLNTYAVPDGAYTFGLPADFDPGWHVYLIVDDVNSDRATNYACAPVEVKIPYTLVYDANGGSGSMDDLEGVTVGKPYEFPECGFQAPKDKAFSYWEMSGIDGIFYPGDKVTIVKNCVPDGKITVTAYWKDAAVVTTEPAAKDLTYTGEDQELVTAGEAENGTLYYALGTDDTTAPETGWSEDIPKAADIGTYYVWYKAVGTGNYGDSEPECCKAEIRAAETSPKTGDASNLLLWSVLALLSLVGLAVLTASKASRKKRQ